MPDIMTLFEMAKASGKPCVYLFEERCTPVQHRRSTCRKCIDACPEGAITLQERVIKIDAAICSGCGACSTICPVEAIVSVNPTAEALAHDAKSAMSENEGRAVIGCERVAVRENPNDSQFAQVPCLCRVHESLLLDLAAHGAREIHLVDGGCKNCKYRKCDAVTREVVEGANQMLQAAGSSLQVQRCHTFPEWVSAAVRESLGEGRREAFSQARGSAQGTIGRAVKFLARKEKEDNSTTGAIVSALGVDLEDARPQRPHRQEITVNALFDIGLQNGNDFSQAGGGWDFDEGAPAEMRGEAAAEVTATSAPTAAAGEGAPAGCIDTRFFGTLVYDTNKCTECGICSAVCRHRALVRSTRKTAGGKNVFLEFTPSMCTQCRLCEEVCYRESMKVSSVVKLNDLFNFEPTLIVIDD